MAKLTLVQSQFLLDCAKGVIKEMSNTFSDISVKHLCIVPDRFSLITEKLIFEVLEINATLNISVLGINKLAKQIIKQAGLDVLYISDEESKMLVRRAMQKTKNNFLCFSKHLSYGLCEEVQKSISQIKSSNISCQDFRNIQTSDQGLNTKLHDLSLIYEEYENLLAERLDAPKILSVFSSLIQSKNFFENTKFFFAGFDSLTAQGYEIVKQLAKNNDVCVGVLSPKYNSNAYIYDKDMKHRLLEICKQANINYEIKQLNVEKSPEKEILAQNIYAFKKQNKFQENNFAQVYQSIDKTGEIDFVAKKICQLTKSEKYHFSDICVCADKSYYPQLRNVFDECDICFFDDQSYNLSSSNLAKFVVAILALKENGQNSQDIIKFLSINFTNQDKKIVCCVINNIIENGVCGSKVKEIYELLTPETVCILEKIQNLKSRDTIENYCSFIKDILINLNAQQKMIDQAENFKQNNQIFLEKVYLQIYDKLIEVIDVLSSYIGDETISIADFSFLIESGLKSVEIRSVPMSVDCVFVGDASESFYGYHKVMFVLGANEGLIPMQTNDNGLISDSDINNISYFAKIEPAVKIVNKRNKFKLYDVLFTAQDNIYITYNSLNADGKNNFVSQFVLDIKESYKNFSYISIVPPQVSLIDSNKNIESLCFNNPNVYYANLNALGDNKQNATLLKKHLIYKNSLKNLQKTEKNTIIDAKNLFFDENKTKISQIESYYACPFAHFLKYGLKLKEQTSATLKANDFGNFLHKFSELFIKQNKTSLGNLSPECVEKSVEKICNTLYQTDYKILNFEENKFTKSLLLEEAKRFATFINLEQQNSSFKPTRLEQYFGTKNKSSICVSVENQNYDIVGIVDRIDECKDSFRIIDYKTGALGSDAASYASLYYGRKIQIFVYLKAVENLLGKKCFGVFYLPISNAYSKTKESHYKMKGFFVDNEQLVNSADNSLSQENPKSRFFEAELSTAKSVKGFKLVGRNKKHMSEKTLENMTKYAISLVENAIKEINEGNIDVSPYDGACEYCQYKNICGEKLCGNIIRKKPKDITISREQFEEDQNGNN